MANLTIKHAIVQSFTTIPTTVENGTLYFGESDGSINCNFGNGMKRFGGAAPINTLTSDDIDKPLSAAQGKVLKTIIDTTVTHSIEWIML